MPAGGRLVLIVFLAIAFFFLWTEHRAHLFGALPYLLVLACPLMHLFMHHGRGGGHGARREETGAPGPGDRDAQPESKGGE
jgi:hypothetical protein